MSEYKKKKGGSRLPKKGVRPRTRKEKIRLAIILALVVVLALLLAGFIGYRAWAKPPDVPDPAPNIPTQEGDGGGDSDIGVPSVGDRKKDFYTFLVVGRDTGGGGNTDTILLAAYDVANQNLSVMSIPRDTMVNVSWDIKRINSVYNVYGGGDEGIAALYTEVSQLVGFMPDFEVVVEWDAVGELVEAIDGVYFDVPRNMDYDDPTQDLHIHIDKGYQLLDGEAAMGVIRWRKNNDGTGYISGDIGRIETQQAFLKAVVAQCLQIQNVAKIQEFAKIFTENVQTDLTLGNLVWFAEQAIFGGLTMEKVNFITLPGDYNGTAWSRSYQMYQSYVLPASEELLEVVNQNFNPYLKDRGIEQLDIMSVNRDGSLSSTTGVVEDKTAAQPPVIPTPEPEVSDQPEIPGEPVNPEQPGESGNNGTEGSGTSEEPGAAEEQEVPQEPGTEEPGPTDVPGQTEESEPTVTSKPDPEPNENLTQVIPVLPPLNSAA